MDGSPLFGHGHDFGYWYYGSIWYGDELWDGGNFGDRNGDGEEDSLDALLWDDEENEGRSFTEWTAFDHPVLGEVEIGGWHPKFFSQNAPPMELERWARDQGLFNLAMAKHLPLLSMEDVSVREVEEEGDLATYEVRVRWRNEGGLPTALKQALLVKIAREDRAVLQFEGALTRGDEARVEILEPDTRGNVFEAGRTEAGATNEAVFRVQVRGDEAVEGTVRILSTRGGVLEAAVTLGG